MFSSSDCFAGKRDELLEQRSLGDGLHDLGSSLMTLYTRWELSGKRLFTIPRRVTLLWKSATEHGPSQSWSSEGTIYTASVNTSSLFWLAGF